MAEKDVLVAWSGGLDSTALVIDYLNKGYTVSLQPIVITCNHYKNIREKSTRTHL